MSMLSPLPGEKILDVGAGKGEAAARLKTSMDVEVYAVDPNEKRVASMRKSFPSVRAQVASAERLPARDAEFDRAYVTMALHHFADLQVALGEIARVLKPGGTFVVLEVNPGSPLGLVFRVLGRLAGEQMHMMGIEQLAAAARASGLFQVVSTYNFGSRYLLALVRLDHRGQSPGNLKSGPF